MTGKRSALGLAMDVTNGIPRDLEQPPRSNGRVDNFDGHAYWEREDQTLDGWLTAPVCRIVATCAGSDAARFA